MMEKRVSPETALARCLPCIKPVDGVVLPVEEVWQRVVAADIYTAVDIPLFSHSLVDGLVLHLSDLDRLQRDKEILLSITGTIGAGDLDSPALVAGETMEIMTGARLPEGAGAIVKREEVPVKNRWAYFNQGVQPGANIKKRGSFLKSGDLLAAAGEVLGASQIEIIAAAGMPQILVYNIPAVYVINTGSELILPGEERQAGQIFASNKAFYYSLVKAAGCDPIGGKRPVKDQIGEIAGELVEGIKCSKLLIISGGTAEGEYDLVQAAFHQIGARMIFDGLDLKPGRHTAAAEKDGVLLINLPGNPGAGAIIFEILVKPLLRKLRGSTDYQNSWFELSPQDNDLPLTKRRTMARARGEIRKGQINARMIDKGSQSLTGGMLQLIVDLDPSSPAIKALLID